MNLPLVKKGLGCKNFPYSRVPEHNLKEEIKNKKSDNRLFGFKEAREGEY
jgi:hypothetical protein